MSVDVHSLVAAYAVNALERPERTLVERHLDDCAECRAELASFTAVASAIADAEVVSPPLALRSRVMEAVGATSQLTPQAADAGATTSAGATPGAERPSRRSPARTFGLRWVPALAGAAASAVLVAALAFGWGPVGGEEQGLALEKDVMMVTSAPDAQSADLDLGSGHLVTSERMEGVALMGAGAPLPEDGMEYQVWLIMEDGSAVPGPTFMPRDGGEYMAVAHTDLGGVASVCITTEPAGGSAHPSTEPMLEVAI